MNDDRYVEYGAATGIVFVILTIVGFAIVIPTPPDLNAPAQEWSSYFLGHHSAVRAGLVIIATSTFFLIWFLGTLTSILRIAAGSPRLPSIALIGGVLGIAALLIGFSSEGWTLALDVPARTAGLDGLLAALDRLVVDAGGRVYLAKDSRVPPATLAEMYPRLEEFRKLRAGLDPDGMLASDLSRRLRL